MTKTYTIPLTSLAERVSNLRDSACLVSVDPRPNLGGAREVLSRPARWWSRLSVHIMVPHPSSKADSSHWTYGFVKSSQRHPEISTTKHHQRGQDRRMQEHGGQMEITEASKKKGTEQVHLWCQVIQNPKFPIKTNSHKHAHAHTHTQWLREW